MAVFSALAKLPLMSEFLIDGAWFDATADRFIDDGRKLEITRGRRDWSERVITSQCAAAYKNADGKYTNRLATSQYYGKLGQFTGTRHRLRWVYDPFDGRTAANGWGTATPGGTGQDWTMSGASASDYAVAAGVGTHTLTTTSTTRNSIMVAPAGISDIQATVAFSTVPTGGAMYGGPAIGSDTNNLYWARLQVNPSGSLQLSIQKRVAGSQTVVAANVTVSASYTANQRWVVRLQRYGWGFMRAVAYLESAGLSQVNTWTLVAIDTSLANFPNLFMRSSDDTATTSVNPQVKYDNIEVNNHRFHGMTSASAPEWVLGSTETRGKVLAPFTATGWLGRLTSGTPPEYSAQHRTAMLAEDAVALWTMEDDSGSTTYASGLADNTAAATVSAFAAPGTVTAAGGTGRIPGAKTSPTIAAGAQLDFVVPNYTETGAASVVFPIYIPSTTNAGLEVQVRYWSGAVMDLTILPTGSGALLTSLKTDLSISDPGYTTYWSDSEIGSLADLVGRPVLLVIAMNNSGSGEIDFRSSSGGLLRVLNGAGSATSYGKVRSIRVMGITGGSSDECSIGAVQVYNRNTETAGSSAFFSSTSIAAASAMGGHRGETAWKRISRTGAEEGIPTWLMDVSDTTKRVGVQPVANTHEIMQRAAEVDQGILYEPRDALGLSYRPLGTLLDQAASVTLDYDGGRVAEPFLPTSDGMTLLNDSTATMDGGTFARVVVRTGPLGTDTIGPQPEGKAWSVYEAGELSGIAGWRTRQGTFDADRYPSLRVNLAAPDIAGSSALVGQIAALDLGDVATVVDLPSWLPPDDVAEQLQHSREVFGDGTEWEITWTAIPARAFDVYEYGLTEADTDPLVGRYGPDPGSAFLFAGITETGTTLILAANPAWDTQFDIYNPLPVRILMEGEEIWLPNAPGGATSPQTFVGCQRSKNGVVKFHNAGATYELLDNAIYAP